MYGSLTNRLNERQASDEIRVGVGATIQLLVIHYMINYMIRKHQNRKEIL